MPKAEENHLLGLCALVRAEFGLGYHLAKQAVAEKLINLLAFLCDFCY